MNWDAIGAIAETLGAVGVIADKRYKLAFLTTGKYQYVNKTKIAGNLSRSGARPRGTGADRVGLRWIRGAFEAHSQRTRTLSRNDASPASPLLCEGVD